MIDDQTPLPTSALADLPSWARIVALVGTPSVIAMYLVYIIAARVPTAEALTAVSTKMDAHVQRVEQIETQRLTEAAEGHDIARAQLRAIETMCVRLSKTAAEQRQCLEGR